MQRILPVFTGFFLLSIPPLFGFGKNFNANVICDESAVWRNYGTYVSCVARTQQEGAAVSVGAKSDIGKKDDEDIEDEDEVSPFPEVSPSPTPSPSPEGLTLSTKATVSSEILAKIIQRLENLIDRLQDLL